MEIKKNKLYIGIGIILIIGLLFIFTGSAEDSAGTGELKEFDLISTDWEFLPGQIIVNEGDLVRLNIKNIKGNHGILIREFGVNERFSAGENVVVEFVADKKGEFRFFCNVYCGNGHMSMNGVLIVL